jgi:predicted porin
MMSTLQSTRWRLSTGLALVAGLCAGGNALAQQQAPVQIYGVLDIGVGRYQASGAATETGMRSGQMAASRIGFTSKEDLGDGMFVGFTLESFLRLDTGASGRNDTDPFWSREATVQVGSKAGTLRIGRMVSPLFESTSRFNAFGPSPGFSPAMRHTFTSGVLESAQGDLYWDSSIAYISPNLGGFTFKLVRSYEPDAAERGNSGVSVTYSQGLVAVALTAESVRIDPRQPAGTADSVWQLAGSYNAGWARLFAIYGQTQDGGFDVASKLMTVGAIVRWGDGNVLAQFAQTNAQGDAIDRKHQTVSLGYDYELSKRQDIYVVVMRDQIRRQPTLASGIRYLF